MSTISPHQLEASLTGYANKIVPHIFNELTALSQSLSLAVKGCVPLVTAFHLLNRAASAVLSVATRLELILALVPDETAKLTASEEDTSSNLLKGLSVEQNLAPAWQSPPNLIDCNECQGLMERILSLQYLVGTLTDLQFSSVNRLEVNKSLRSKWKSLTENLAYLLQHTKKLVIEVDRRYTNYAILEESATAPHQPPLLF